MRFTFIHAADLHIDSPLAGLGCKDSSVRERFARAGRQAVENLIAETINAKAAFLLICGDIFDGDWKDVSTGLFLVRELAKLERAGIGAFVVKGNHDFESAMSRALPFPDGVKFFSSRKAESHAIDELRVALHGRSFASRLVGPEFVASYPARRDGWFNIGLLHTALDGTRGHESYAPCSVEDLKRFGYDYWALGHVHEAEEVSRDPWIVYPGNIQGRHVREAGAKGAMRVTVEDGRVVEAQRIALDAARWANVGVDVSACADESAALAAAEARIGEEQAGAEGRALAARVTFEGDTPLHARLVARRETLEEELRAIGFRYAEDLWVESLKLATTAPSRETALLGEADALDVEALLAAAAADPEFAQALAELIGEIDDRLPRELRGALAPDGDALTELSTEARDRLCGELFSREATP
jgi:DNA repair exonuclease SbcCD nuclease subunit